MGGPTARVKEKLALNIGHKNWITQLDYNFCGCQLGGVKCFFCRTGAHASYARIISTPFPPKPWQGISTKYSYPIGHSNCITQLGTTFLFYFGVYNSSSLNLHMLPSHPSITPSPEDSIDNVTHSLEGPANPCLKYPKVDNDPLMMSCE